MMNMKKTASVTRVMEADSIGLTMFGTNEDVKEEDLQVGIDIALTVMPAIFKCVQRHLDDFEGEEREIMAAICESWLS